MVVPRLPTELLSLIIDQVAGSHHCRTCYQHDLLSLALASRLFNALATPKIYESVCLRSHGAAGSTTSAQYETRLEQLQRTLKSNAGVAALVERLRFAHEEAATGRHWAEIVGCTPNLRLLQGVDSFFAVSDAETHEADEAVIAANAAALASLRAARHLRQAVVHQEVLPASLARLLEAWPALETLVLGDLVPADYADDADISYASLAAAFAARHDRDRFPARLRNLYFHDCDLDYAHASEREGLLAALPPLERLGVEYSLGFSLAGIGAFLSAAPINAATLHTLDFHRQLRSRNPCTAIVALLAQATGLKHLSLELIRYQSDTLDDAPPTLLASASLEVLRWVPTYVYRTDEPFSGDDEFNGLLVDSLTRRSMPALQRLVVGHDISARGARHAVTVPWEVFAIYDALDELVDRGFVSEDPATAQKSAAVLLRRELPPQTFQDQKKPAAAHRVPALKRGFSHDGARRGRCDVAAAAPREDVPGVVVPKEQMWGGDGEGDLLSLWVGGR